MIVELLEKLISRKYYEDKQIIDNKLSVFYAMNKITDEEYSNLTLKVEDVYAVEDTIENEVVVGTAEENAITEEEA